MGKKTEKRTVAGSALKIVYLEGVRTDPSYQRAVVAGHKKIIANFDPVALGIPLVGEREDGTLWIVDGLQRLTALRKMGKKTMRAEVFRSQGPEHEASVFRKVNKNRTALQPLQLFQAALTEGSETAWEVKKTAEEYGFEIVTNSHRSSANTTPEKLASTIRCISAVQKIHKRAGAAALRFVFSVLKDVWPDDAQRMSDTVVFGLYLFWSRREGSVDTERLIPRLATTTPSKVIYSAQLGVGDNKSNAADVFEKLYKKRTVRK
jgi:hypothetical protein